MSNRFSQLDSARQLVLVGAILVPFVTFGRLSPLGVTMWALVVGGIACVAAVRQPARMSAWAAAPLAALFSATVFFLARGVFASSPAVSVFGTIAQHNGAALWVAALCAFATGLIFSTRASLRLSVAAVSLAGVAYGFATLVEVAFSGLERDWGSAAGVFENSSSLGQFMALAACAGVAWALLARAPWQRRAAYAAAAFCLAIIFVAQSRAGLLGIAIGAFVAFAAHLLAEKPFGPAAFGAATVTDGFLVTALAVAASRGSLGAAASRLAAGVGNNRDAIWRSAYLAFKRSPFIGRGLEQFSACVTWSFKDGRLLYNGTYDPHNAVLAVLVGGGVIGALLAALAAASVLASLARSHARSGRSPALVALIAAIVAVPASALVTWFAPVAVVAAAFLAGSVIGVADAVPGAGTADPSARVASGWRWVPVAAGALAIAVAAYGAQGALAEARFDRDRTTSAAAAAALPAVKSWPDPAFAAMALKADIERLSSGDAAAVSDGSALIGEWRRARDWHFDLAIESVIFEQGAAAISGTDTWDEFEDAIAAGKKADPASGLWDFLGALEAERLGKQPQAKTYAEKCLTFPLGDAERAEMRRISGK